MNTFGLAPFAFVIAVPDMAATSAYFENALGFSLHWEEASDWRLLSRGGVNVMIGHCPGAMRAAETGDPSYFAYLHVDDVDGLHIELRARGALVRQQPMDRPYGLREMLVETPDGHRIMFGQDLAKRPVPA